MIVPYTSLLGSTLPERARGGEPGAQALGEKDGPLSSLYFGHVFSSRLCGRQAGWLDSHWSLVTGPV